MKYQPGFTDFFMSPVTGRIILPMFPDLTRNYIWIGDRNGRPIASPALIDLRLEIIDLRNRLSRTRFILQAASENFDSSQALNQLVPGILKHTDGIVSIAVPGSDYPDPNLTYKYVYIGNEENKPQEYPTIQVNNLPDLTFKKIWMGDEDNRPVESDAISGIEINIDSIFDSLGSIFDHLLEIDINIDHLLDFELNVNIEIGDINVRLGDIDIHLGDIDTHLGDIDTSISSILDAITTINTQISSILDAIATINAKITSILDAIATINAQITGILEAITTINAQITSILDCLLYTSDAADE